MNRHQLISHHRQSSKIFFLFSAVSAGAPPEKFFYDEKDIREHGLGVITAAIFLAGEMAGSGVLALPAAMIGTGRQIMRRCISSCINVVFF